MRNSIHGSRIVVALGLTAVLSLGASAYAGATQPTIAKVPSGTYSASMRPTEINGVQDRPFRVSFVVSNKTISHVVIGPIHMVCLTNGNPGYAKVTLAKLTGFPAFKLDRPDTEPSFVQDFDWTGSRWKAISTGTTPQVSFELYWHSPRAGFAPVGAAYPSFTLQIHADVSGKTARIDPAGSAQCHTTGSAAFKRT
jgi:hypothetical protein